VLSQILLPSTLMIDKSTELDSLRSLDTQAVSAVYDRYYPEVYRYVRYRLGDETLAEDIASEVFICLLEAEQARRGPKTYLRGWLIGTANHLVTDHLRLYYRRPVDQLSELLEAESPALAEEIEQRESSRSLYLFLMQLTNEQQHVLALRFGQGYSLEETAAVMKKNVNTVKALQFRALAALHRKMGDAK
jgi:RNA polymerase sigma-70 factor (ECF subfamily)